MKDRPLNWLYSIVDHLSDFLVSLAFLVPIFFGFMAYRFYEIFMLFQPALDDLGNISRTREGAILIGAVGIFTTLIFMVHSDKLAPVPFKDETGTVTWRWDWSKLILVLYAFVINTFFWRPWDSNTQSEKVFRWFCCVMFSSWDYGFVHLFKELRKERGIVQDISSLEQSLSRLEDTVSSEEQILSRLKQEHNRLQELIDQHTCPYCRELQPSPESLRSHKGHCKSKPVT